MDYNNDRIVENPNEDYSKKTFIHKPKNRGMYIIAIPIFVILGVIFALNIFMYFNNFGTIIYYSDEFGVDPAMVASIIHVESKFDTNAVSNKDAYGLMQITYDTYDFVSERIGLEDVEFSDMAIEDINIMIGTYYYKYLLDLFNGNVENALCAYNAGPTNVQNWLKNQDYCLDGENLYIIPYSETEHYVNRINVLYPIYKVMINLRI